MDPHAPRSAPTLREPGGHAPGVVEEEARPVVGDELRGVAPVADEHRAARARLLAPDRIDGGRRVLAGQAREREKREDGRPSSDHPQKWGLGNGGVPQYLVHGPVACDPAGVHLDDPIDELLDLLDAVRAEDGDRVLAPGRDLLEEGAARAPVEVGRGLVAHQDLRLGGERQGGEQLLPHPSGQIAEAGRTDGVEIEPEPARTRANGACVDAAQGSDGPHHLAHGRLDRRRDLRDVGHVAQRELGLTRDVDAAEAHVALDPHEAEHGAQERGLARAVRAHEADPLARLDAQADVVERPDDAERLGDVADVDHRDLVVGRGGTIDGMRVDQHLGARPAPARREPLRR